MTTVLVYIFPTAGNFDGYANRFADSFRKHDPEYEHTLLVSCNGNRPSNAQKDIFHDIPCIFLNGDNVGWDIGAYQQISTFIDSELMVCFGSSTYFKRKGWLFRMVSAYVMNGDTLYGATACLAPNPHIRTTAFWCNPSLLRSYPHLATTYPDRYSFEHGPQNFTIFSIQNGCRPYVVYWDDMRYILDADGFPNGYHIGDQSQLLAYDRCTELHCP